MVPEAPSSAEGWGGSVLYSHFAAFPCIRGRADLRRRRCRQTAAAGPFGTKLALGLRRG